MNLKILSAAFLMGVSATSLLAQTPPNPPTQQTCTKTADTYCDDAAAVYNAIIENPAVTATTTLAGNVASLQSLIANPMTVWKTPDTSLYQAQQLLQTGGACATSVSQQCTRVREATQVVGINLANPLPLPSQVTMNTLVRNQENMSQLNSYSNQFYMLFYAFDRLDVALSAFPSTLSTPKINKPLPTMMPKAGIPPQKGTVPSKK